MIEEHFFVDSNYEMCFYTTVMVVRVSLSASTVMDILIKFKHFLFHLFNCTSLGHKIYLYCFICQDDGFSSVFPS